MIGLGTVGDRFQSTLISETGLPFKGTIIPIQDAKLYPDDFYEARQILRIRSNVPLSAGDVVQLATTQRYLLGTLDQALDGNALIYTSFQLYPCNKQALWQRETTKVDALTQLARGTGMRAMGTLWVLIETLVREARSSDIRTAEETKRVVTGAAVELNDIIDGMKVRKINITHGVRVLEVS